MRRVLIVEDDPMVARINQKYVEAHGQFEVVACVMTEKEIVNYLNTESIDLIILDVYLPEKSGIEILKSLRDQQYYIDVIMVTAANGVEEVKRALAYGVVDYIIKPFELDRFKQTLDKFLEKYKLFKQEKVLQSDIDSIYTCKKMKTEELPKGIQKRTLEIIIDILINKNKKVWTIRDISELTKISNVTVKKYMDYLESCGVVQVKQHFGIGRPEHHYTVIK